MTSSRLFSLPRFLPVSLFPSCSLSLLSRSALLCFVCACFPFLCVASGRRSCSACCALGLWCACLPWSARRPASSSLALAAAAPVLSFVCFGLWCLCLCALCSFGVRWSLWLALVVCCLAFLSSSLALCSRAVLLWLSGLSFQASSWGSSIRLLTVSPVICVCFPLICYASG